MDCCKRDLGGPVQLYVLACGGICISVGAIDGRLDSGCVGACAVRIEPTTTYNVSRIGFHIFDGKYEVFRPPTRKMWKFLKFYFCSAVEIYVRFWVEWEVLVYGCI